MKDAVLSWEECVKQVCVLGSPDDINEAAGKWGVWLQRLSSTRDELHQFKQRIAGQFHGPAGDAYQQQLDSLIKQADAMDQAVRPVVGLLGEAARTLAQAQAAMPIPDHMLDEVMSHRDQLHSANRSGVHALAGYLAVPSGGLSVWVDGFFGDKLADTWVGKVGRESWGRLADTWRDRSDELTNEANKTLHEVNKAQNAAASEVSGQSPDGYRGGISDLGSKNPTSGTATGSAGHVPHIGGGGGHLSSSSSSPSAASHFDPLHPGSAGGNHGGEGGAGVFDPPTGHGWDPDGSVTGLAGAGDTGFQGATGLGSGIGSSASSFGAVASSTGVGALGGGLGAAAGAGASGPMPFRVGPGGGGTGSPAAGMVGAGQGAGAGGQPGDERTTWLKEEDEDVWGANDVATPTPLGWNQ